MTHAFTEPPGWDRPPIGRFDPGPQSPLLVLSNEYEKATDAFAEACDADAEAENAYLAAFSTAWAVAVEDHVATTARRHHCDAQPEVSAAKQAWNRAAATKERTKAKARELEHRIMAMQSHMKFVGGQT